MKIAFTICSNNYLSQAKTLGDSFLLKNYDYQFYIGLCDKLNNQIDYSVFDAFTIIPVEELSIPEFETMLYSYNIVELNTSIKPFYFSHFFETQKAELVMYIDPDIYVFDSFKSIEDELQGQTCLLTPHVVTPLPLDGKLPNENEILNHGLYNLGFAAFNNTNETKKILHWWAERMKTQCVDDTAHGFFVDQLTMNLLPLFFKNVCISKNLGLNVANWNLNERKISKVGEAYVVNEKFPLVFFHYSNYNPTKPEALSAGRQTRFDMGDDKIIKGLFDFYTNLLFKNKYVELKKHACHYVGLRNIRLQQLEEERLRGEKKRYKMARKIKKIIPAYCLLVVKKFVEM